MEKKAILKVEQIYENKSSFALKLHNFEQYTYQFHMKYQLKRWQIFVFKINECGRSTVDLDVHILYVMYKGT